MRRSGDSTSCRRDACFVCHDYKPGGREARCETTIAAEREANIHLKDGTSEDEFTAMRRKRDATLDMPALLYPAVQFNIRGGRPPPAVVKRAKLPEIAAFRVRTHEMSTTMDRSV
jgi:hypothetical protein